MERTDPSVDARLLGRLVELVERLLETRFLTSVDVWQFQLDVLSLQQDIQSEISEKKALARNDDPQIRGLASLRRLRRESRRLGDALAWLVLSERHIVSLSENQATSVIGKEEAEKRGLSILQDALVYLSQEGHGFPLLHDITDILRIGDVTFISPDGRLQTVELKCHMVKQEEREGQSYTTYDIDSISVDENVLTEQLEQNDYRIDRSVEPRRTTQSLRQINRMVRAHVLSTVPDGTRVEIDGNNMISTAIPPPDKNYSDVVSGLVDEARANGAAIAVVCDFVVVIAFYDETGVTSGTNLTRLDSFTHALQENVRQIVVEGDTRNHIIVNEMPSQAKIAPDLHKPYFLLPIPLPAILDLACNRLNLVLIWNPAPIVRRLEEAGFTVSVTRKPKGVRPEIMVSVGPENTVRPGATIRIGGLDQLLSRMLMEFLTPEYIVHTVEAMLRAVTHLEETPSPN